MEGACCTCATLLANIDPIYDEKTEKPRALDRRLECCSRTICGNCITNNSRFATYCPFCQVSIKPSPLPQGLRDPPSYTASSSSANPPAYSDDLPSYSSVAPPDISPSDTKSQPAEDVLHFLDHTTDTLTSLSFRYNVPLSALRKTNNITSDHLLLARRAILIPGEFYKGGISLSPRPVEGEEEERRKGLIRKWMVACKVSSYVEMLPLSLKEFVDEGGDCYLYDVALLYLEQAEYDLDIAIGVFKDDERWEKEHPMESHLKGKGKGRFDVGRRRFTGQK